MEAIMINIYGVTAMNALAVVEAYSNISHVLVGPRPNVLDKLLEKYSSCTASVPSAEAIR